MLNSRSSYTHRQQSSYSGASDDDDVSDDPAWMNAPRGSLQPAFSPSLMKKTSLMSTTDSQTSSPLSPSSNSVDSTGDEEEHEEQCKGSDLGTKSRSSSVVSYKRTSDLGLRKDSDFSTKSRSSSVASYKRTSDLGLRKDKSMLMNQASSTYTAGVNKSVNLDLLRNSCGDSGDERLSVEEKNLPIKGLSSPPSAKAVGGHNGYRDSMMRYRPSDLKPYDYTKAMMSRDSLAPENFGNGLFTTCRSNNTLFANGQPSGGRSSNAFNQSHSLDPFPPRSTDPMDGRGSVMHFGPRVTEEGLSNYLRAAKSGNIPLLRKCLEERNTDFTERDPVHGQSAMHIAVRFGQLHAVQLLCGKNTRGLLIDAVDNRQNTPLHLAAAKSRRITKYLLEHGADASRVNNRNQTPLAVHIITTKRDDPLVTEMLLQHKMDPNGLLGNSSLLHKAVDLKLYEIACRLVRYGARLNAKDSKGQMVFEKVNQKVLRQLCSKISYPPVWVPDTERKNCMCCRQSFSHFGLETRRHHCRHCGRLICGRCSHLSVESEAFPTTFIGHIDRNPSDERSNLKRVCNTCNSVFKERAKEAKENAACDDDTWLGAIIEKVAEVKNNVW